jgi:hypothetical protein
MRAKPAAQYGRRFIVVSIGDTQDPEFWASARLSDVPDGTAAEWHYFILLR